MENDQNQSESERIRANLDKLASEQQSSYNNSSLNASENKKKKGWCKYVIGGAAVALITFFGIRSGIGIQDLKDKLYEQISGGFKDDSYLEAERQSLALQNSLRQDSIRAFNQSELERKLAEEEKAKQAKQAKKTVRATKPKPRISETEQVTRNVREFIDDLKKQSTTTTYNNNINNSFDKIHDGILDEIANYLINVGGYDETDISGIREMDKNFYSFVPTLYIALHG